MFFVVVVFSKHCSTKHLHIWKYTLTSLLLLTVIYMHIFGLNIFYSEEKYWAQHTIPSPECISFILGTIESVNNDI